MGYFATRARSVIWSSLLRPYSSALPDALMPLMHAAPANARPNVIVILADRDKVEMEDEIRGRGSLDALDDTTLVAHAATLMPRLQRVVAYIHRRTLTRLTLAALSHPDER